MQYFYDGQIRRYLLQVIRLLSNFVVKYGDGTLVRVPVMYGDMDRQAATIINQNSSSTIASTPRVAVYVSGLELDRARLSDSSYIGKVHIREREFDANNNEYTSAQGSNYTVERLMPTPFKLTIKADIWSESTEQKLQILEQILVLFNPSLEIQTTDNYIDWTSLSVVDLTDVTFSSRTIPVGTNDQIDIATLTLETPIWITPPAKVKKLGIVTSIITSLFTDIGGDNAGYVDGLGVDPNTGERYPAQFAFSETTTIGNFDIIVSEGKIKLVSSTDPGKYLHWGPVLDQYPGKYHAGLSKVFLRQPDNSDVVGYFSLSPVDPNELVVNWDEDTYPTNTSLVNYNGYTSVRTNSLGTFDAIIDPTKTGPGSGLTPSVGSRYLILENIGGGVTDAFVTSNRIQRLDTGIKFDRVDTCNVLVNGVSVSLQQPENRNGNYVIVFSNIVPSNSTISYILNLNEDGPDSWKNSNGSDFIAETNDIIEWNGTKWSVIFSAKESRDQFIYLTNIFTLVQYKWDGVSWTKSFDGEYKRGQWRIEL
jgi:hypothetical protein